MWSVELNRKKQLPIAVINDSEGVCACHARVCSAYLDSLDRLQTMTTVVNNVFNSAALKRDLTGLLGRSVKTTPTSVSVTGDYAFEIRDFIQNTMSASSARPSQGENSSVTSVYPCADGRCSWIYCMGSCNHISGKNLLDWCVEGEVVPKSSHHQIVFENGDVDGGLRRLGMIAVSDSRRCIISRSNIRLCSGISNRSRNVEP